jgi:hypothetical protein
VIARRGIGWLITAASLAGGSLCGRLALREVSLYLPLARGRITAAHPDWAGPPHGNSDRYRYRLVIRGALLHRPTGYLYDAVDAWNGAEEAGEHHALSVEPFGLEEATALQAAHKHVWLSPVGTDLGAGRFRLHLDRAMLPTDGDGQEWEGALEVRVWEYDRNRQAATTTGLALLGLLLGVLGVVRLRFHFRPLKAPGRVRGQAARLLARIRQARDEALVAANAVPHPELVDRIHELYCTAEHEAKAAAALERGLRLAGIVSDDDGPYSGLCERRSTALERLHTIHAVLLACPARLELPREGAEELIAALDRDVAAVEEVQLLGRSGG